MMQYHNAVERQNVIAVKEVMCYTVHYNLAISLVLTFDNSLKKINFVFT